MEPQDRHDGDTFLPRQRALQLAVRRVSESENLRLLDVRQAVLLSITSKHKRASGKKTRNDEPRLYWIAQYLLGIDLSYAAIVEGLYAQAANLQKQQIETLAKLEELNNGIDKDGKVPNVRQNNLPGIDRLYGNLNDAAHPSKREVVESLTHHESLTGSGPSSDPRYESEICNVLLGYHCVCLLHLWRHMANIFATKFDIENSPEEEKAIDAAIDSLKQLGFISIVSPSQTKAG